MGRRRAIQNTPGRFGMQASNREVVAALAEWGIGVTEGLVRQIKVGILKDAAKVEWRKVTVPGRFRRPQMRRPPKMPPPR